MHTAYIKQRPQITATPQSRTLDLDRWIKDAILKHESNSLVKSNHNSIHTYCQDTYDYAQLDINLKHNAHRGEEWFDRVTYEILIQPTVYVAVTSMLGAQQGANA